MPGELVDCDDYAPVVEGTTQMHTVHRPRTAVVTGAASGMGKATAERLLGSGYRVIGIDISDSSLPHFSSEYTSLNTDVRSLIDLRVQLDRALEPDATVDLIANVAGVYPPTTLDTYDQEMFRRIFDINVLGVLNVIRSARQYLTEGSAIVNFASVDAFSVSPGQLLYGASKAAVVMLTKSLALELAAERIRVNGIAPGWVATPGNAATGRMKAAAHSIPMGRVAEPHEIAKWVEAIADPDFAGFLTGETIVLSGGDVIR